MGVERAGNVPDSRIYDLEEAVRVAYIGKKLE
jgi:hypothetical protein